MRTVILAAIGGFAAAGGLSLAAPANAYSGGCYTDNLGRCYKAAAELMTEEGSPLDRAAFGFTPDQHYAYLITHSDHAPFTVIYDFDAAKAEGFLVCAAMAANGSDIYLAARQLQESERYASFNHAANIAAAAHTIYCPTA